MTKDSENILLIKSYAFALRIIQFHRYLRDDKKEYELAKQLLRSGTSIGANAEEAVGGISKKDFIAKIGIAYKEARETKYWLRLLKDSNLLESEIKSSLILDVEELLRITGSIIKTSRNSDN